MANRALRLLGQRGQRPCAPIVQRPWRPGPRRCHQRSDARIEIFEAVTQSLRVDRQQVLEMVARKAWRIGLAAAVEARRVAQQSTLFWRQPGAVAISRVRLLAVRAGRCQRPLHGRG
ncbi:hypothetical protein, partial [Pseudomonas typographi]|uniref:hypothetical protein n=1 Tax=Pseudomonas typographi TaxID=2715964 RepID=UPI001EEE4D10